jgi:hypothetical protein
MVYGFGRFGPAWLSPLWRETEAPASDGELVGLEHRPLEDGTPNMKH